MSWIIAKDEKNGLLDTFSGAAAAYSLRNLQGRSGKDSAIVRVRRSSDNTESDFTATEVSDGTLAAWVGAGNDGFVRTWYDQSGNSQDAIQLTAANQPKIVDSASGLILENGKPGVSFDGSDDFLQAASVSVSQPATIVTVVKKLNPSHYFDGATSRITLFGSTTELYLIAGASQIGPVNINTAAQFLFFVTADTTDAVFANSSQQLSGNAGSAALTSLLLGRQTTGLNYANQTMQDFIIYPNNQSANRASIEANINAHYSIYP